MEGQVMRLGDETIPPGEDAAIDLVVRASEQLLDRTTSPVRRDQHPKQHGTVRAEFTVLDDLRDTHRVGLFREPRTYPAWVRFSNGGQQDDRKPDAHGMAVKLMGVEGQKVLDGQEHATTQDFVLVDNPVFFLPDAVAYGAFSTALLKAKAKEPSSLYSSLFFLPAKARELATVALLYFVPARVGQFLKLLRFVSKTIGHPLATRYWSTTPYAFGPGGAMKFSARPTLEPVRPPASASAEFLRQAMVEHLSRSEALFEFQVQLQEDPIAMPIEDPTVAWDEARSPFVTVARLRIPTQEFATADQLAFGEQLSFTPWHAIIDHRPLGGINRTRKTVYSKLSRLRHELNGAPMLEPTP
jgi:hypothetical protein